MTYWLNGDTGHPLGKIGLAFGLPLRQNPIGRTGIRGRGVFGKMGTEPSSRCIGYAMLRNWKNKGASNALREAKR